MRRYPRVLGRFRQGLVGELEDVAGAVRGYVHSRFAVPRREGQPRSIDGRRLLGVTIEHDPASVVQFRDRVVKALRSLMVTLWDAWRRRRPVNPRSWSPQERLRRVGLHVRTRPGWGRGSARARGLASRSDSRGRLNRALVQVGGADLTH